MFKYASYNTVEQIAANTKSLVTNKVGNLSSLKTTSKSNLVSAVNELYSQAFLIAHPVGSIYMSTSNVNPSTTYGGTWESWGSGRVPVGVNASDSDFSESEKTGGAKTINLAHSHTVNGHTHSISHTHTVNSHTHSTANHTLTGNEMPSHNHYEQISQRNALGTEFAVRYMAGSNGSNTSYKALDFSTVVQAGGGSILTTGNTGGNAGHNHGNTGAASPATGGASTSNSGSSSPGTNSQLSSSQKILPPYITCYMWLRTA